MTAPQQPPLLMTVSEVAALCRVCPETVRRKIRSGSLAAVPNLRPTRVRRSVFLRWLVRGNR